MALTAAPPSTTSPLVERALRLALAVFVGTMAFSVAGMLLIRLMPQVMGFFGPYYPTLVKAPTWTYMVLLPVIPLLMYGSQLGTKRTVAFFVWGSVIGAASELIGTTTGVPFGAYAYTSWLGPKIADHVPYFIPTSWFAMSIVSFDLARRLMASRLAQIVLAAFFMVLWDVSLDPAMGSQAHTTFWSYPEGGFYYGMPLSNWAGWFGVSLVIMGGYSLALGARPLKHRLAPLVYGLNGLFPLLLCLLYGLYGAFFIGAIAILLPLGWLAGTRQTTAPPSS